MLSKKYYQKIADILRNSATREEIIVEMAVFFKDDNPRFERFKFLEASGYEKQEDD